MVFTQVFGYHYHGITECNRVSVWFMFGHFGWNGVLFSVGFHPSSWFVRQRCQSKKRRKKKHHETKTIRNWWWELTRCDNGAYCTHNICEECAISHLGYCLRVFLSLALAHSAERCFVRFVNACVFNSFVCPCLAFDSFSLHCILLDFLLATHTRCYSHLLFRMNANQAKCEHHENNTQKIYH